jgi:hypothetical protein
MGPQILKRFYGCTIESILTGCITAWYNNCSASNRKALQRVVHTVQFDTGAKLTAIQDLYTRRCQMKDLKIVNDPSHPSHRLFSLLPHGKGYRSAKSRTKSILPPSHKTPEQVIKWLPGLFALHCKRSWTIFLYSHTNVFEYEVIVMYALWQCGSDL